MLDHAVNLGTLNEHQNRSFFNFRKPKGSDVTATLRLAAAPSASYLVWYGSALGAPNSGALALGQESAHIYYPEKVVPNSLHGRRSAYTGLA